MPYLENKLSLLCNYSPRMCLAALRTVILSLEVVSFSTCGVQVGHQVAISLTVFNNSLPGLHGPFLIGKGIFYQPYLPIGLYTRNLSPSWLSYRTFSVFCVLLFTSRATTETTTTIPSVKRASWCGIFPLMWLYNAHSFPVWLAYIE